MGLNKKQLALIEAIDKRVEMTREFMNDWLLFNQILSAYPSPGVNKAQLENQFLKIKSKLAREHRVLKDTLAGDYAIDQNTMNIVSAATNLESIYSQSEVAVKKIQNEWHRSFISINETLGTLEDKKNRAESGEKIFLMPGAGGGAAPAASGGGGMSAKAKKTLITIVVLAAIAGVMFFFFKDTYLQSMQDLGIIKRTSSGVTLD